MNLTKQPKLNDGYEWKCRSQSKVNPHDCSRSVRKGSWFAGSHLSIRDILKLTNKGLGQFMQKHNMAELDLTDKTVTDRCSFCREVCQTVLIEESTVIGGVGSTVEIDESKFGKMKYGRGRTSEELVSVLKEWVLPGTEIISDCWKAYDCLKDEGFTHLQVQQNLHFKDPETGAHTNTIEGTWSAIKRALRNTPHDLYLFEYVWRKTLGHSVGPDAFEAFKNDIIKVYTPWERDHANDADNRSSASSAN
ncbi:hypothetical protein HNY73_019370 [Argiope bruennichi]|uniref:ISXO2-like transposase domain-containing protein n=1 Tax=Argiope bruennichi TaxID=94029 RepID=A0A8T0EGF0_ARGBR|nr:hypothetical protein HNY73_019370 [Argiope bruennichi]